ncbi:hypothetical protein PV325_002202 [Microctonus aethiopoides]|uniref:Uncharacterized protein n=1 Tax=Microctonus aethiopoides TaxID=144406 RepID=A0AA39EZE8_9HYME|nr:hypothetical protein PV325_002202 [Microctonus aethiopoides]KAK0088302.1 hypothetical protein PV326_004895 [Microctonus aethiopoides]KAK0160622.1 hypothetical protein PV328_008013 [Microctonus aethiopoides]
MRESIIIGLLSIAITATFAAPSADKSSQIIPILEQSQDGPNPDGSYSWNYSTGNNINANEKGFFVRSANNGDESSIAVEGSYSYINDDGTPFHLTYVADENGFMPKSDNLPVPPEIPPAILRGLEWIANHPEEDKLQK